MPSIQAIPNELITSITARVASSSLPDLHNFKQTCRLFREIGDDDYIFHHVTMDSIPVALWFPTVEAISFIQRCRENGNPEAIFRLGFVYYFSKAQHELGRAFLAKAADLGHEEAAYVLGIIIICTDNASRSLGMAILDEVKRRKVSRGGGIWESRNKLQVILLHIWRNEKLSPQWRLCMNPNCKDKMGRVIGRGWDDVQENYFSCEACMWDNEVNQFCRMLRGY